jgi:hypothetical protein
MCRIQGLEFLSIDSDDEMKNFRSLFMNNSLYFDEFNYIGGIETVPGDASTFEWVESGKPASGLNFEGIEPSNFDGKQHCLAIQKHKDNHISFDDNYCDDSIISRASVNYWKFICQEIVANDGF